MRVTRLLGAPIITPGLHPSLGKNIQGPSLIRVPDWVHAPLGTYYLYFADHKGSYIRLAYADDLRGPWAVYPHGSLQLADSCFLTTPPEAPADVVEQIKTRRASLIGRDELPHDLLTELTMPHIASPDVHVDPAHQTIVMYFHGLEGLGQQVTRVATSPDGIQFAAGPEILGRELLPRLSASWLHLRDEHARPILPIQGWSIGLRRRPSAVQQKYASCGFVAKRGDAVRVLDPGRRHTGTHSAEQDRCVGGLGSMASNRVRRNLASGTPMGRCRCAVGPVGA